MDTILQHWGLIDQHLDGILLSAGLIAVWKRVPYWEMAVENALTVDQLSEILPLCLNR